MAAALAIPALLAVALLPAIWERASPDGRRVAYHSRRSGEWGVWQMAAQ